MEKVIEFLQGKKAHFFAICIATYSLLKAFNVITTDTAQDTAVYGLLGALFGIAVKAGINRELKGKKY